MERFDHQRFLFALLVALLIAAGLGGCKDEASADESQKPAAQKPARPAAGSAPSANPSAVTPDPSTTPAPDLATFLPYVGELDLRMSALLSAHAAPADRAARLKARLDASLAHLARRDALKGRPERPSIDLYYEEVLANFYELRAYAPVFTDPGGALTHRAKMVLEAIASADAHALDAKRYWPDRLRPLVTAAEALSQDDAARFAMEATEMRALAEKLAALRFNTASPDADARVVEVILAADSPLPRLRDAFQTYQTAQAKLHDHAPELEVLLADAWLRFAKDLRHGNFARLSEAEKESYGKEPAPSDHATILRTRLFRELETVAGLGDAINARGHLAQLPPEHEQYTKLQAARARYKKIVAAGGWSEVPQTRLRKGRRAPRVKNLKARLAAEGYFQGPVDDDLFDDALSDAISTYQETHQINITGDTSQRAFWGSLNKTADWRLAEIEVNLRRWHRSLFSPSERYVYINIPDFHGELWRDGQRVRRFRIVVGNRDRRCDPETKTWTYANATPIQHARMTYLVLNPYWNVPIRIEREEYLDKILENPAWLEENGFEYANERGYTRLRQIPGEGNALGRVKFIFPNPHSTFMHDTPLKRLFDHPVRAFSHGCMRVHEPLALAEEILTNEGKWTKDVQDILDNGTIERQVPLSKPIDVYVEYFSTRVDDQGRVNFLADPYDYIRDELNPPSKNARRCRPTERDIPTLDERPIEVSDDGTVTILQPEPLFDLPPSPLLNPTGTDPGAVEGQPSPTPSLNELFNTAP